MRSRSQTPIPSGNSDFDSDVNSEKSVRSLTKRGVSLAWINYIQRVPGSESARYSEYKEAKKTFEATVKNLNQLIRRAGKNEKTPENDEVVEFLQAKLAETRLEPPVDLVPEEDVMKQMAKDMALSRKLKAVSRDRREQNLKRAREISSMVAKKAKKQQVEESSSSDSEAASESPVKNFLFADFFIVSSG